MPLTRPQKPQRAIVADPGFWRFQANGGYLPPERNTGGRAESRALPVAHSQLPIFAAMHTDKHKKKTQIDAANTAHRHIQPELRRQGEAHGGADRAVETSATASKAAASHQHTEAPGCAWGMAGVSDAAIKGVTSQQGTQIKPRGSLSTCIPSNSYGSNGQ